MSTGWHLACGHPGCDAQLRAGTYPELVRKAVQGGWGESSSCIDSRCPTHRDAPAAVAAVAFFLSGAQCESADKARSARRYEACMRATSSVAECGKP